MTKLRSIAAKRDECKRSRIIFPSESNSAMSPYVTARVVWSDNPKRQVCRALPTHCDTVANAQRCGPHQAVNSMARLCAGGHHGAVRRELFEEHSRVREGAAAVTLLALCRRVRARACGPMQVRLRLQVRRHAMRQGLPVVRRARKQCTRTSDPCKSRIVRVPQVHLDQMQLVRCVRRPFGRAAAGALRGSAGRGAAPIAAPIAVCCAGRSKVCGVCRPLYDAATPVHAR